MATNTNTSQKFQRNQNKFNEELYTILYYEMLLKCVHISLLVDPTQCRIRNYLKQLCRILRTTVSCHGDVCSRV